MDRGGEAGEGVYNNNITQQKETVTQAEQVWSDLGHASCFRLWYTCTVQHAGIIMVSGCLTVSRFRGLRTEDTVLDHELIIELHT